MIGRESSQSEVLQAPPVKVMRSRRTRSGPGQVHYIDLLHTPENKDCSTGCKYLPVLFRFQRGVNKREKALSGEPRWLQTTKMNSKIPNAKQKY